MSKIQQFYAGQNIFVTGGTGFLGKALIEKLLRSCPDIGTIYLLIRAKKGKSPQERIESLLVDPVFEVLRTENPEFSKKLVGLNGDTGEKELGLSAADYARIVDEVSVIFHLAATVRFNEKLEKAAAVNVNSVKSVVDIARACKNLKVGVHVSTAYSNCVRKAIGERLYPSPLSYEGINELIEDASKSEWTEEELSSFTKSALGEWPNTYSFTKVVAEGVIAEYAEDLPFAVFRPSIDQADSGYLRNVGALTPLDKHATFLEHSVVNAYREPVSGWLSGPIGLSGLVCGVGLGILRAFTMDMECKMDIVPVDYVSNALISCAWETVSTKRRNDEDIPVYNYVSGTDNPVFIKHLIQRIEIIGRGFPTNSAIYYPSMTSTKSLTMYAVLNFLLHLLPALLVDNVAKLFGKQLGLYRVACKVGEGARAFGYFTTRDWDFENQRVTNLWKQLDARDRLIFPFNIQDVDWDEHMLNLIKGLRRYLIREPDSNLEEARQRAIYLYIIATIVRLVLASCFLWIIWKLFCWCSSTIGTETLGA